MSTRIGSRVGAFLGRIFPERQIYHRADGQVRYISLSTKTQLLAAGVSALAVGWTGYATASVMLRGHLLSAQNAEAAKVKAKYERWLAEARAREASALALLQTRTTDFEFQKAEIERRHETLQRLLEHATGGEGVTGRSRRVAQAEGGDAVLMVASVDDPTPRRSRLAVEAGEERVETMGDPGFDRMMIEQEAMLDQAEENAQDRVENLRAVLRLTELSPDQILQEGKTAQGGPYVGLSSRDVLASVLESDDPFARRVSRVAARVMEAEELERAIDATPLGFPVGVSEHRLNSKFGRRRDPITGAPAHHAGLDFSAYRLAPITAAAPGRVSFVGWKGGYGRVVEIDHGHGFKTRYGHMHKATVKRGDVVSASDKIGEMGNTGRSTGTHVHYEVWFKGKVYDPEKFLKAGEYVQQT